MDLVLIHAPQPWSKWRNKKNRYFEENRKVWRANEDAYKLEKIKAIGDSNFLQDDLESLFFSCKIKPMINRILCHVGSTRNNCWIIAKKRNIGRSIRSCCS